MTSERTATSLSLNSATSGSSETLVFGTSNTLGGSQTDDGFVSSRDLDSGVLELPWVTLEHKAQTEERTIRSQISPSLLLDHETENENGNESEERGDTSRNGLGSDHRRDDEYQHDESFNSPQNSMAQLQKILEDVMTGPSADTHQESVFTNSTIFDMDRFLRGEYDKKPGPQSQNTSDPREETSPGAGKDNSHEEADEGEERQKAIEDKNEAEQDVTPPETPEIRTAIEIPADLRSRSPNITNLIQKRKSSTGASAMKSPAASCTPTPVERSATANTSVGVFINGKLSGHSEQRSILTSHYLAINSLGVLSYFHYRLRATELPDCVAALANGEIIVADNHSDIRRLKFFDGNQRYQRSLPLIPEFIEFESPPYVTDIQLSDQDTRLWICDCFNQTIREIDLASGHTYQMWENHRLERGQKLLRPGKIAITPDRVYVCDAGDQSVKAFVRNSGEYLFKFKIGLKESEESGYSQLNEAPSSYGSVLDDYCGCPWSIHWTMDETLLVGDIRYDFVYIVDKRGKQLGKFGGNGKAPNKFHGPVAICSDGDGNIAIADAKNGRVQILTRDMMSITQVYPVDDCEEVSSLALTSDGMLTVIDHLNNLCLIF